MSSIFIGTMSGILSIVLNDYDMIYLMTTKYQVLGIVKKKNTNKANLRDLIAATGLIF